MVYHPCCTVIDGVCLVCRLIDLHQHFAQQERNRIEWDRRWLYRNRGEVVKPEKTMCDGCMNRRGFGPTNCR